MKRVVRLEAGDNGMKVKVTAEVTTHGSYLTRVEVDRIRGELTDELMKLFPGIRWLGARLSDVKVK